jgi:glucokinase
MIAFTVGIDIGGTTSVIGLVDSDGRIVRRVTIDTPGHPVASDFFNSLADAIEKFDELQSVSAVLNGIGIGAPNGNYYNGTIEFAPNLEWKGIVPVVEMLQKRFPDTLIKLTNDANAAALGEMIYGNAKGVKDFIMITLGTGVGSGIVVDGKLVYGHDGFAGEIGHTIYDPEGRLCGCGRRGCLETYASAGGLLNTAKELLADSDKQSILRETPLNELKPKNIGEAAQNGDSLALEAFDITAKILAIKLADSVAHTSPSVIYIFGGLANAGDVLMKPLKKYFEEYLLQIYKNKIKLMLSGLPANDAAILGAAALVHQ